MKYVTSYYLNNFRFFLLSSGFMSPGVAVCVDFDKHMFSGYIGFTAFYCCCCVVSAVLMPAL